MIDASMLRNGMILHARTRGCFGRMIRRVLRSWGNHDALLWQDTAGVWWVLDSEPPVARLTPLSEWLTSKGAELRFYWPHGASISDGNIAAKWWLAHVRNSRYDYWAFPRLLWRAAFGPWWKRAAGKDWAWYCTEGVRGGWAFAGYDPWGADNPTPGTSEKRVREGAIEDWTGEVAS